MSSVRLCVCMIWFLRVSLPTRIPGFPCCPAAPISPGGPCNQQERRSQCLICHLLLSTNFFILTMFPFEPWTPSIPRIPCEDRNKDNEWKKSLDAPSLVSCLLCKGRLKQILFSPLTVACSVTFFLKHVISRGLFHQPSGITTKWKYDQPPERFSYTTSLLWAFNA